MLYITTRDNKDAFTAHHALKQNFAPDGGLFVPFRIPCFEEGDITKLKNKSFGQITADILNLFFSVRITGWDVDFWIGRNPFKFVPMARKVVVAETWHNPSSDYSYVIRSLCNRIKCSDADNSSPSEWAKVAVRIATLFSLFGELMRSGYVDHAHPVDIAVKADDFDAAISAWYARKMGLPIANIICSCDENDYVWDFVRRGELNTNTIPVSDVYNGQKLHSAAALERLIQGTLGCKATCRYLETFKSGGIFALNEEEKTALSEGLFVAVVSKVRINSIASSVFRSNSYTIDSDAACSFGGLQDYRASTGETRLVLLLSEHSPM